LGLRDGSGKAPYLAIGLRHGGGQSLDQLLGLGGGRRHAHADRHLGELAQTLQVGQAQLEQALPVGDSKCG